VFNGGQYEYAVLTNGSQNDYYWPPMNADKRGLKQTAIVRQIQRGILRRGKKDGDGFDQQGAQPSWGNRSLTVAAR
jgi:hypothetical protein